MQPLKHTFRKTLNSTNRALLLLIATVMAVSPTIVFASDDHPFQQIDAQQVQRISHVLKDKQDALHHAYGKDIVVLMGSTGVGKSTLVNLLSNVPLVVDDEGNLITEWHEGELAIGSGFRSVTKYPGYRNVPNVGIVYDLPGFEDTEGTTDDILNAAFIRHILTKANSVKVLFITSKPDMDAGRGTLFKRLLQAMNMFREDRFRNASCLLVVNKVDRDLIEHNRISKIFEGVTAPSGSTELTILDALIQQKKVIFVPKTRIHDAPTILEITREELAQKIQGVEGGAVSDLHLHMAPTFNADTKQSLVMFFYSLMQDILKGMQQTIYATDKPSSTALEIKKEQCWDSLQSTLKETQGFQLLQPLGEQQYHIALKNFKPIFEDAHDLRVRELQINEMKEAAKDADLKKCLAEYRHQQALEETASAQEKAKEMEKAKQEAEKIAQRFAQEAEDAKQNAGISEEERDKALQRAIKAEEERKLLEHEIDQQKATVQCLFEYQKQAEAHATILRQARADAEQNKVRAESQLDLLRSSLSSRERELSSLRQDLESRRGEQVNVLELQRQIAYLQEQLRQKDFQIAQLSYAYKPQEAYSRPESNGSYDRQAIARMYHRGNMTQQEVANHFGCSVSTVSRAHSEYYG